MTHRIRPEAFTRISLPPHPSGFPGFGLTVCRHVSNSRLSNGSELWHKDN
jgi:hypothetical protein